LQKLFLACIFIAAATAAVIPVEQARHRRDVSEIVNEYIPPAEEVGAELAQDPAALGEDGYRYKTVRRLKLRHRRDVSEIANEYLPPTEDKYVFSISNSKLFFILYPEYFLY